MRLDHVALATRDAGEPLATLVGELGATVLSGGLAVGYRPMQVHLGTADTGMKVELLEPWDVAANDFLDRFVTRHGEGAHHLTFKVDDIDVALERVAAAGIDVVGVDLSQPIWKEAFIQPRDAHGTVVQLAESSSPYKSGLEEYAVVVSEGVQLMGEPWWPEPPPRAADVTVLRRVVMRTPSLPDARAFFAGLLDGAVVAEGVAAEGVVDEGGDWVELEWPGGGHLRLEQREGAVPGVDRLEAEGPGPTLELTVAGTRLVINPAV